MDSRTLCTYSKFELVGERLGTVLAGVHICGGVNIVIHCFGTKVTVQEVGTAAKIWSGGGLIGTQVKRRAVNTTLAGGHAEQHPWRGRDSYNFST